MGAKMLYILLVLLTCLSNTVLWGAEDALVRAADVRVAELRALQARLAAQTAQLGEESGRAQRALEALLASQVQLRREEEGLRGDLLRAQTDLRTSADAVKRAATEQAQRDVSAAVRDAQERSRQAVEQHRQAQQRLDQTRAQLESEKQSYQQQIQAKYDEAQRRAEELHRERDAQIERTRKMHEEIQDRQIRLNAEERVKETKEQRARELMKKALMYHATADEKVEMKAAIKEEFLVEGHAKSVAERELLADADYLKALTDLEIARLEHQAALLDDRQYQRADERLLRANERKEEALARAKQYGKEAAMASRLDREMAHAERMQAEKFKGLASLLSQIGLGLKDFLGDKRRIAILSLAVGGTIIGVKALSIGLRFIERVLKRPSLVRETSHKSLLRKLMPKAEYTKVPSLNDLIIAPELKAKLQRLSAATVLARQYGANLPGVMIYGAPGNGKTMFMRALAAEAGMNYAMISGGDVSALLSSGGKNMAVTQLHKLFDWAVANGPTLLFIDEAGSFLKKGRAGALSEGLSATIDAFLSRTGGSTSKVQIVIATNHPHEIDAAVASRLPVVIKFPSPGPLEREKMYDAFLRQITATGVGSLNAPVQVLDEVKKPEFIQEVVAATDGFSGRDMTMKLFDSVNREMLAEGRLILNQKVIRDVLESYKHAADELTAYAHP